MAANAKDPDRRVRDECARLGEEVRRARAKAKHPELIDRSSLYLPRQELGEIAFVRRWNSHTPMIQGGWGGGCFLRWRGKGTVIDPGCTFLRAFQTFTRYPLEAIDMMVCTHDHVDHCNDLVPMVSLLREFNKQRIRDAKPPHSWDLVLSHGVCSQYQSVLNHPENTMFLTVRRVLAPRKVDSVWELPDHLRKPRTTANWPEHLRAMREFYAKRKMAEEYHYEMFTTRTKHRELLGEETGFGVTFHLQPKEKNTPCKVVSFSGDTGVSKDKDGVNVLYFRRAWQDTNLLVLHVGTTEDFPSRGKNWPVYLPEHLGFCGVRDILYALERRPLEMVVLAEWGSEFGGLGIEGRRRFCELLQDALEAISCTRYYSITRKAGPLRKGAVPIVPSDIGLRVSLPEFRIWCESEGEYLQSQDVLAEEHGERIIYQKRT